MKPNDTASPATAPHDEDRIDYPDDWPDHFLDRRGRGTPRPVAVDPEAPQRLREVFASHAEHIEIALGALDSPEQVAAIRAGLAGEADPLGAALAVALAAAVRNDRRRVYDDLAREAWITTHGITFAAEAALELLAHYVQWWQSAGTGESHTSVRIVNVESLYRDYGLTTVVAPMRSILAALPDDRYAEVRAAVDARLSSPLHRFFAAALLPDQDDLVREACRVHATSRWAASGCALLWSIVSTPEHLELSGARRVHQPWNGASHIPTVVDALGGDALGLLTNVLDGDEKPAADMRDQIYDMIGRLPADEAVAYLVADLTSPQATAALDAAARRFPNRTLRAVAAAAPTASAGTRARLAGLVESIGVEGRDLSEADRTRLDELIARARRHPVAAAPPEIFTTPPWTPFTKSKPLPVEGLAAPETNEIRWAAGEREEWLKVRGFDYWRGPDVWKRMMPNGPDPAHYWFPEFLAYAPESEARPQFERWDGTVKYSSTGTMLVILARYGLEALPKIQALVKKKPSFRDAMMPIVSLEAARLVAGWLGRSRNDRLFARAWLDRHAAEAARLLVPDAIAKVAKPRQIAADALRYLAADRELVLAQAATYGENARAAVEALLDTDPLDPQRRVPKAGAWADPALLPPVLLRDGEALPAAAVGVLMSALALDDFERPYPGVDLLAAECDPASLSAFSWALFELWLAAGSPSKDAWAMDQLGRFGDEDAVRRLTALIREWPGRSQSRKAVRGLEVLGAMGTEAALRSVQDISRNAKFKALKKTAVEQIEVIAERLELSTDQLADRLVPDFGLASGQALVLDYGPREFTVKFDERLRPFVIDGAGKRRASVPKPGAKDDPDLARAAFERFGVLRKELKTTAAEQVKRFESAMIAGRSWPLADFRRYLVDHPLVWQLSSRLVWRATWEEDGAEASRSFRVAEDRTFADVEDDPFAPGEGAVVRLAHPVTLGAEVEAWATVLADYEILQPFDQLARPVFTLSEEERKTGRLTRFEGPTVGAGPLVGLLKRGWQYGAPAGRERGRGLFLEFAEGGYLHMEPSPGVYPGYDPGGDQTLQVEVKLPDGAQVDPVVLSEAISVVAKLTHTA